MSPCQRFTCSLATTRAWLGARLARYALPVRLLHSRLHAGLSRRTPIASKIPQTVLPSRAAIRFPSSLVTRVQRIHFCFPSWLYALGHEYWGVDASSVTGLASSSESRTSRSTSQV